MAKNTCVKRRSDTEIFLIGHPSDDFPVGTLPLKSEVLQYLLYCKSVPNLKGRKLTEVVSCPQERGSSDMICSKPGGGGCCDPEGEDSDDRVECVVHKIKMKWLMSGIPIISGQYIRYEIILTLIIQV